MTKIMDGKALAAKLRAELKEKVAALKDGGKEIGLAVVLIGDDQASMSETRSKAVKKWGSARILSIFPLPPRSVMRKI